jgi:hypothetical protein
VYSSELPKLHVLSQIADRDLFATAKTSERHLVGDLFSKLTTNNKYADEIRS